MDTLAGGVRGKWGGHWAGCPGGLGWAPILSPDPLECGFAVQPPQSGLWDAGRHPMLPHCPHSILMAVRGQRGEGSICGRSLIFWYKGSVLRKCGRQEPF